MSRRDEAASAFDDLARRFHVISTEVEVGPRVFRIWRPRSADELISAEDFDKDERLPYWADIWPSSLVLAGWMLEQHGATRRVLELGCGLGVVTTAACIAGYRATATDYYEDALRFARENVAENAGATIETRLVDWRDFPADLGRFDLVLASDVLYERPYGALVASAIHRSLAPGGAGVVADPGRIAAGDFVRECEVLGMRVEKMDRVPIAIGEITQHIDLYRVTGPGRA